MPARTWSILGAKLTRSLSGLWLQTKYLSLRDTKICHSFQTTRSAPVDLDSYIGPDDEQDGRGTARSRVPGAQDGLCPSWLILRAATELPVSRQKHARVSEVESVLISQGSNGEGAYSSVIFARYQSVNSGFVYGMQSASRSRLESQSPDKIVSSRSRSLISRMIPSKGESK